MTGQPTAPSHDETPLALPPGDLCISLQHNREFRPARGAVTFGEPGTRHPGVIWADCWRHAHPRCAVCWHTTGQATQGRPAPGVTGTTHAPGRPPRPAGHPEP